MYELREVYGYTKLEQRREQLSKAALAETSTDSALTGLLHDQRAASARRLNILRTGRRFIVLREALAKIHFATGVMGAIGDD